MISYIKYFLFIYYSFICSQSFASPAMTREMLQEMANQAVPYIRGNCISLPNGMGFPCGDWEWISIDQIPGDIQDVALSLYRFPRDIAAIQYKMLRPFSCGQGCVTYKDSNFIHYRITNSLGQLLGYAVRVEVKKTGGCPGCDERRRHEGVETYTSHEIVYITVDMEYVDTKIIEAQWD